MPATSPSRTRGEAQAAPPLDLLDLVLLVTMVALFLFASWYRSQNRIFWGDEIMGWLVLRQDSWAHLFRVWYGGIDSSGLFFYVFGRPWLRVFGATELDLHLFSAFGMAVGVVFVWLCARRFYRVQIVAAVVPALFLINRTALWQLTNGRTYGIVLSAIGLTCYALVRTSPEQEDADRRWFVLMTAAASMLLVGSHILGVLYWSAFFTILLARDAWFRTFRPRLYLASLTGLFIFLVSWKNIAATTALGKPSFWTLRPGLRQLPSGFDDFSPRTGLLLIVGSLVFTALLLHRRAQAKPEPFLVQDRMTLYCILAAFALLAIGILVVSKVSTPIFVDRYMLPMLVGDMLLLCELTSRVAAMLNLSVNIQTAGMVLVFLAVAAVYRSDLRLDYFYPQRDYTTALLQKLPADEPIILTAQGVFFEMIYYRNTDRRFEAPVDWGVQLDPDFGPGGVSGTHELENWRTYGFFSDHIKSTAEILDGTRRFAVASDNGHTLWVRKYLLNNPAYTVTELPPYPGLHIWQVEKK